MQSFTACFSILLCYYPWCEGSVTTLYLWWLCLLLVHFPIGVVSRQCPLSSLSLKQNSFILFSIVSVLYKINFSFKILYLLSGKFNSHLTDLPKFISNDSEFQFFKSSFPSRPPKGQPLTLDIGRIGSWPPKESNWILLATISKVLSPSYLGDKTNICSSVRSSW